MTGSACWRSPRPPPRWSTASPAKNYALGAVLLFRLLPAIVLGPAGRRLRRPLRPAQDDGRRRHPPVRAVRLDPARRQPRAGCSSPSSSSRRSACSGSRPRRPRSRTCCARTSWSRPTSSRLVTTYGLTPVAAAVVFALLTSARRPARHAAPAHRPGRPRALPQRAHLPGRRAGRLAPAARSAAGAASGATVGERELPRRRCAAGSPSPGTPRWSAAWSSASPGRSSPRAWSSRPARPTPTPRRR